MPLSSLKVAPRTTATTSTNVLGTSADYEASRSLSAAKVGMLAQAVKHGALEVGDFAKAGLALVGMKAAEAAGAKDLAKGFEAVVKQATTQQASHEFERQLNYAGWRAP